MLVRVISANKSFDIKFNPSLCFSMMFIGTLSFDLWHILTASGLELTGGNDFYSFLDSIRLRGE